MIIIQVAVEAELSRDDLPEFQIEYSGVGKVNAAIKTLEIIHQYSPSLIINYGTAGALTPGLSGLIEISRFCQRDMDASPLGFAIGQTPFEDGVEISFGNGGYSCGTGDSFVTEKPPIETDLVDMEAYAIAKICRQKNVNFRCFKYISDNADEGANDDWVENVAKGKALFLEKMKSFEGAGG